MPSTRHTPTGPSTPLAVELDWHIVDGRPECDGVHVTSPTGAPITSTDLRAADLPKLIGEVRAGIVAETGRGQMRRSTEEKLKQVAEVYKAAFSRGDPPVVAVEKHLEVTRGTASSLVARARAAGFLPPTSPGAPQA